MAKAKLSVAAEAKAEHRAVDNLLIASTEIQLVIVQTIESMSTANANYSNTVLD